MNSKTEEFRRGIRKLLEEAGDDAKSLSDACKRIVDTVFEELGACERTLPGLAQVSAEQVMLAVTDISTGRVCVRLLPMSYAENHNGIILTGENLSGDEVKMAYLSSGAIEKIKELRGEGENSPRCHD